MRRLFCAAALALLLAACGGHKHDQGQRDPYSSTYAAPDAPAVLIRHATVLTGTGSRIDDGDVLLAGHKIEKVGKDLSAPSGAVEVDAQGRWVTPGIVDPHSHLGVYASPEVWAMSDGNEATSPTTPNVWSEHSIWPQDPGFEQARRGGVTSMMILPGSANLIGGRGTLVKNVPATTYQEMKFPGAPQVLKMACGENPKRVYGLEEHRFPSTWMGDVAGYREAFAKAAEYKKKRDEARGKDGKAEPPERDLGLDTLADVLDGKILVEMHCYRADQMATMLDVAQEFHFKIAAFHHAVEAYKIAPMLKAADTCAVMWADWWGFKMEAFDGIRENIAMVDAAGACATVHSDDPIGVQRLNQEAGKAMAAGWRAGLDIPRERAIRWITANPAKALGVADRVGTLEQGKDADVVVWSADPFSVYAHADLVYIDGVLRFDRANPPAQPDSDFKLGLLGQEEEME
jgi:imidazolonepropionase-like amidohydrolase